MIDISIIIPVYNTPKKYIECAINSILNQNYPNLEILLIDDNSNLDETILTCKKYQNKKNVKYIRLDMNLGVSNARNVGIKNASKEYIMFLDADDWFEKNTFSILNKTVKCNPNYQIYMFNSMTVIDGVQNSNKFLPFEDGKLDNENIEELKRQIIFKRSNEYVPKFNCIGVSWAKLYSRSFILDNSIFFDEKLRRAEDHIFILSLLKKNPKIYYLNNYMYNYRRNYSSAVNRHNKNVKEDFKNTLNRLEELIELDKNQKYENIFYSRIAEYFILNFYSDFFHIDNKISYKEYKKEIKILKGMYPYSLLFKYDLNKIITADETRKTIWQTKYKLYLVTYIHFKRKH